MKLKNKKTGDIVRVEFLNNWQTDDGTEIGFRECNTNIVYSYNSLAELNAEWEDIPEEEPKEYWYISDAGEVYGFSEYFVDSQIEDDHREIGNLFETREEAEKAVEKLKAWKRLKDKGIEFFNNKIIGEYGNVSYTLTYPATTVEEKDLALLLGGEE